MKMITTFLLILLACSTKSQLPEFQPPKQCSDYEENGSPAFSLDFCRTTVYDYSSERCCYYQYEDTSGVTHYHCKRVSLARFWEIDDYIDDLEKTVEDVEILDCHASYLYASIFLIFALIF